MTPYQALISEIDTLIKTKGYLAEGGYSLRWQKLSEKDQSNLVSLFIVYDDKDLFSIYENAQYDDILNSLLNTLQKDTPESAIDFTDCLKKNLIQYYGKIAQVLINERCLELENEELSSFGYTKRHDRNTNEWHLSII